MASRTFLRLEPVLVVAVALVACGSESRQSPLDAEDASSMSPDQGSEARDLASVEAVSATDVGVDSPPVDRDVSLAPDANPKIDMLGVDSALDVAVLDVSLAEVGAALDGSMLGSGEGCTGIYPNSVFFTTEIGQKSLPLTFTIPNFGATAVPSITADFSGPDLGTFTIVGNTCVGALPPGQTCQISVVFNAPAIPDLRIGLLTITGGGASCAIPLVGQAVSSTDRDQDSGVVDTSRAPDATNPGTG